MTPEEFDNMVCDDRFFRMLEKLPVAWGWIMFKGETIFAGANYAATKKAGKPMLDIYYCATAALNDMVLQTVQWDKNKFKILP